MRNVFAFLAPEDLHEIRPASTQLKRFTDTFVRDYLRFLRIYRDDDFWLDLKPRSHYRGTTFCALKCRRLHVLHVDTNDEGDSGWQCSPEVAK
jgi:hypothetical protein